jgi:NAD(P)-dependent dehydrogenase (short-subunit alcohol dehydrogenase family)
VFDDIDLSIAASSESQSWRRNHDKDAVFIVNGSSRGIGLQFVKALSQRTQGRIAACCRLPDSATGLTDFLATLDATQRQRIQLIPLDLEDQSSIETAAAEIADRYHRVDLLLNVAGILGDGVTTPGPERSIAKLDRDWMEKTLAVNLIGPVMFSKSLAPLLKSKNVKDRTVLKSKNVKDRTVSIIANLSARVGSISDNDLGGWYSYRMSKSALNQATRTMAHELKRQGTWTIALHPGTTDTDLSKPFQRNVQDGRLFPVEFTCDRLLDVIDHMEEKHSGGLFDWAAHAIPF